MQADHPDGKPTAMTAQDMIVFVQFLNQHDIWV